MDFGEFIEELKTRFCCSSVCDCFGDHEDCKNCSEYVITHSDFCEVLQKLKENNNE